MATLRKHKRLLDAYRFAGFHPQEEVRGIFGDSMARVVTFVRRSKKLSARSVVERTLAGTTARHDECGICPVATRASIWNWKSGEFSADVAAR
jgi:hypothetical protein